MTEVVEIRAEEVVLREAGADDLPVLALLYGELYAAHGASISPERAVEKLGRMLGAPCQRARLFEATGRPIGFALWAELGDHVFLRDYVITAAHRGRGLGAALFERLRAEALPDGLPIRLEASAAHAQAFWTKRGFGVWSTGMRSDCAPPDGADIEEPSEC